MKKVIVYILTLMCVIFILPSICTRRQDLSVSHAETEEVENTVPEEEKTPKYEYSKYATIKLYHTKTSEVEELPLDEYLYGVVSSEMPANFEKEALKAQAVVARTYTLYQIINSNGKHGEAGICDDSTCCQAWISKEDRMAKWDANEAEANWTKIVDAVDSTQGQIITYNGEPIDAFFHSNSGGVTETAANVWGGTNYPYLQSVETSGEDGYSQYNSEVEISKEELIEKLKQKHSDVSINFDEQDCIKIIDYTESGRVKTIKFGNIEIAGTEVRSLFGLKSTNFSFEITENSIKLSVIGYGHGAGMRQTGADRKNFEKIIKHFYTIVEITYVNEL